MTSGSARVKFSFSEGLLEVEGSEGFVAAQLQKLEPILEKYLSQPAPNNQKPNGRDTTPKNAQNDINGGLSDYENLFALADGKIQILKDIPGGNKSSKTVNVALLLGFANQLQGINSVGYSTIRDLCAAHACLDSANFSKSLKDQKELFLISGSSGSQSVTLTAPGKRKASELANSLRS